jgi:acyl-CoA reductase-like NAD-dependent aldehyde dehydrogenase
VSDRLPVRKTYKLFVGGAFPRSESGRTLEVEGHNVARASRKDVRDAVVAARKAVAGWSGATAYNRFDPASPFGGYKESGFGREGGRHGLEPYLEFD